MAHIRTTNATVREHYEGQYECVSCGLDVPAVVYATGYGGAHGHGDASAREALDNAEYNANSVATRTLLFIPCPKCGRQQPGAAGYRLQVMLGSAALGVFFAWIMFKLMDGHDDADAGIAAAIGAVIFAIFYWYWGRPWRGVKKRSSIDMNLAVFHERED